MQFLVFSLCPLHLLLHTTEKTLLLPRQVFICVDKINSAIEPQLSHPLLTCDRCSKMWPSHYAHTSLVWEAQHPMCAHTHSAQGAVGLLCCEVTAGSWSMHPPGPPGLF